MADYYPLLARAVAALPDSTPDARRAIYERARKALIGQLRRVDPPVPEEDIQRENDALDAAAAKVEADFAKGGSSEASPPPKPAITRPPVSPGSNAPAPVPPPPPPRPASPSTPAPARAPSPPSAATAPTRSPAPAPTAPTLDARSGASTANAAPRVEAAPTDRPAPAPRPGLIAPIARDRIWPPPSRTAQPSAAEAGTAPSVAPPAQPAKERPSAPAPTVGVKADSPPPANHTRPTLPIVEPATRSTAPAEPEVDVVPPPPSERDAAEKPAKSGSTLSKLLQFGRPRAKESSFSEVLDETGSEMSEPTIVETVPIEQIRPIAPQAPVQRTSNIRYWVFAAVLLVVVGGIATLAFRLRDNPEDFARVTHPNAGAENAEAQSGKIVERIGAGPATPAPRTQPGPTRPQTPQTGPQQAPNPPLPSTPIIPVAHRAALLIEAPDDPQRVKTFVGTVLWRIDRPSGAPPSLVADLDLPDARFKAIIRISKNTDPRLPASHTIDLRFTPAPDGEIPDVKEIDTLQMRAEDRPAGEPLSGIPAAITANYFLIGLGASESAQSRNLELIRTRGWFDLPMLLINGKIAKITFEKGTTGDRMFNEVLAAWKSS